MYLYSPSLNKPPVTLLVMSVSSNIIFDPSREELAVADAVLAISVAQTEASITLVAMRAVDPPSRLTTPGVPNSINTSTGGTAPTTTQEALTVRENADAQSVWRPPRGGMKRALVAQMVKMVVEKGGVGQEVMEGLQGVEA